MELAQLKQEFKKLYGDKQKRCFHSPGRVNLIGEHVDYNGGVVFPCALSFGTYAVVSKRDDDIFNFASTNFNEKVSRSLSDLDYRAEDDWVNYLKGVINEFDLTKLSGLDILISGNIPTASGLSSSASIELLMAVIINEIFGFGYDSLELVKMSLHAENEYIGMKCGIMDQFAVGMGKAAHAMLLDCDSLKYEYVPIDLKHHKIIISNTNKPRGLQDSKYNERRRECELATGYLNKSLNISLLGELTPEQFEENKHLIEDPIALKRATHIIYEIKRTKDAVKYLNNNDIEMFGKMMNESHISLRDLYEVSCRELDILVEQALKIKGTIGSRMTGAGFGGCTVSIVSNDYVDEFIEVVSKNYLELTGNACDNYIAEIGDGAKEIID